MNHQNIIHISSLQDYYFSGNIPTIAVISDVDIEINIQLVVPGQGLVIDITELHTPDFSINGIQGIIYLDIADIISTHLYSQYPVDTSLEDLGYIYQTAAGGTITIAPDEQSPKSFNVIKGIIDEPLPIDQVPYDQAQYLEKNLLSMCPQIRNVKPEHPNALNYYLFGASSVIAVAKMASHEPYIEGELKVYLSLSASNRMVTFDASFDTLAKLFTVSPGDSIVHIDVYAQNNSSGKKTAPIRLIPDNTNYKHDDLFAFENTLGGIDIIRFKGVLSEVIDHEYLSLVNKNKRIEHRMVPNIQYKKNTGFLESNEDAIFAADFLASSNRYHFRNGSFKRIIVTDKDAGSRPGELNAYSFSFSYAHQHQGKFLTRQSAL